MVEEYSGPLELSDSYGHTAKLQWAKLWAERHESEPIRSIMGATVERGYQLTWQGSARVPGLSYRLLDVLGGTVTVTLPDGRVGKAYATGWSEDSVWFVEIQGVGPFPRDPEGTTTT